MIRLAHLISCMALGMALVINPVSASAQRTSGSRDGRGGSHQTSDVRRQQQPRREQSRSAGSAQRQERQDRRHNASSSTPRKESQQARPAGNYGNYRPGNNSGGNRPGNNGSANRPGYNNGNGNNNRPGHNNSDANRPRPGHNNGGNANRPGNNNGGNNRPGNHGATDERWHFGGNRPSHGDMRPGTPPPPPHNARPPRPNNWGHPGHRPPHMAPPMRPHRPPMRPWHRPVPPPSWRPRPHAPLLSTVLGITFGTALNLSLDLLFDHGYTVDGYGNNVVYLRDVNQYNYFWPDATLYYDNGGLQRSEFLYSTPYPDSYRYSQLYNNFLGVYGAPVNVVRTGATLAATWFAPNRGYITLQYAPQYAMGGSMRYFTTLTFGL